MKDIMPVFCFCFFLYKEGYLFTGFSTALLKATLHLNSYICVLCSATWLKVSDWYLKQYLRIRIIRLKLVLCTFQTRIGASPGEGLSAPRKLFLF